MGTFLEQSFSEFMRDTRKLTVVDARLYEALGWNLEGALSIYIYIYIGLMCSVHILHCFTDFGMGGPLNVGAPGCSPVRPPKSATVS